MLNPRITKGVVATTLTVLLWSLQNAMESDVGHVGNLFFFYILCGHFDGKKMGVPPYPEVEQAVKVRR